MDDKSEVFLKNGLYELFDHIKHIRREIAAIRPPDKRADKFSQISDELDAIVESTEEATNNILENIENIDDIVSGLLEKKHDEETRKALNSIYESAGKVVVACSFQDITGQRVTKVVKSLQFIEERINKLVTIWGEDGLKAVEMLEDENSSLLNGPQLKGQGVSQEDVDKLLESDDAENQFFTAKGVPLSESKAQAISKKMQEEEAQREQEEAQNLDQSDIDSLFD